MVYASKTIDIVLTLTGGGPGFESSTLTNIVYVRTFKELKFAYGAAMSWFLIVIVMALVTSTFVIMMRVGRKAR
jgi:multiple sugar transport system permease protein